MSKDLERIYGPEAVAYQRSRFDRLVSGFRERFDVPVSFVSRAPGRVNMIGEHIDYCGFSVLPTAIDRDIIVACGVRGSRDTSDRVAIHLSSLEQAYEDVVVEVKKEEKKDGTFWVAMPSRHGWASYVVASLKTILGIYKGLLLNSDLYMLYDGSIPSASGLSSSSALTVASVLAFSRVLGIPNAKEDVTELSIKSEHLVGVNSGGMDQAASVFSKRGGLLHISFNPALRASVIPVHPNFLETTTFVIANSLVTSEKAVTAKFRYNLRVVETRLATFLLAQTWLGLDYIESKTPLILFNVVEEHRKRKYSTHATEDGLILSLSDALSYTREFPHQAGYTPQELYMTLSIDKHKGKALFDAITNDIENEPLNGTYELIVRARHVLSEALRVYEAKEALQKGNPDDLGALMNVSQDSCARDYLCSCPELDNIVSISRACPGVFGSRLTGAGWGGSTVTLVRKESAKKLISELKRKYYDVRFPTLDTRAFSNACFPASTVEGAGTFEYI